MVTLDRVERAIQDLAAACTVALGVARIQDQGAAFIRGLVVACILVPVEECTADLGAAFIVVLAAVCTLGQAEESTLGHLPPMDIKALGALVSPA